MGCTYSDITGYGDYAWVCDVDHTIWDTLAECAAHCSPLQEVPPPEKYPTSITLGVYPLQGYVPLDVTIEGELKSGADWLSGKTVKLYRNGSYVKTTRTGYGGLAGIYTFEDRLGKVASYTYQTKFAGDATYKGCKSRTVKVTAKKPPTPPPPPPPPDEWTHKLILYYYRLPWADAASVEGAINTLLIPTLNGLEWLLGYDYVSHQHDWKGMTITVYYAARGTPVVPIWGILLAIGVLLLGVGVVIMGAAWCIAEVTKYEGFKTKSQMLKEGTITTEEYKELLAAQKENPAPWEKALGWGAIIIILLLLAGARRD